MNLGQEGQAQEKGAKATKAFTFTIHITFPIATTKAQQTPIK